MHDDLLLRAAKSGQAKDGIQDGESGGGDFAPPVEGLARVGMIMRYLSIRRVAKVKFKDSLSPQRQELSGVVNDVDPCPDGIRNRLA